MKVERADFVANNKATRYAVSFDRRGRLGWKTSEIVDEDPGYGGAHIIEVFCENVADAYLAYLQKVGISYVFAGKTEMDLAIAVEKLKGLFDIKVLLLEGGSVINGAFQRAGLIDELSLVQAPIVAEADDKPLFEGSALENYRLEEAKVLGEGALWSRYKKKN